MVKMGHDLSWLYDEFRHVGTDYGSKAEVESYDARHADFRDAEAESIKVLDSLDIKPDAVVIDFGSGTGTFSIQAARRCAGVHAVDVSPSMIEHARAKAARAGAANIEFHHAGFLTYEHEDSPVDAIVTTFALHHLPDFWKGVALKRMHGMLKPDGRLYIHDVILEEADALENVRALIGRLGRAGGKPLREEAERHFRDEYSTYDWVIDGLLARAGFILRSKRMDDGVLGTYICSRG